ncbi:mitochondrial 37S ribosomal protein nam9, partial [Rhizoclosmatium hyalinum]
TVATEDSKEDGKEVLPSEDSASATKASAPESEKAEAAAGAKEPKEKKLSQLDLLVKKHPKSLPFFPLPFMAPWMFIPAYLEVCYNTCSTVFLRTPLPQPNSVEIPSPHAPDMHALAYEWYSSIKRSKTKRPPPAEPLVVNGRSVRLKTKFDSIVRARLKQERDERWAVWAKRDEDARIRAVEAKESKVAEKKA